jgi:hypothetical protein
LNIFNSVLPQIQFTIEEKNSEGWLAFLDCQVHVNQGNYKYKWYQKDLHSGNMLNEKSNVPTSVKHSFIINRFWCVLDRSNILSELNISINKMYGLMVQNLYDNKTITQCLNTALDKFNSCQTSRQNNFKTDLLHKVPIKLKFTNQGNQNKLKNLCHNSRLKLKFCNEKFLKLKHLGYRSPAPKLCKGCKLCTMLSPKANCNTARCVYQYTCKICKAVYIGHTINAIKIRHRAHSCQFNKTSTIVRSALSAHFAHAHSHVPFSIDGYDLSIIKIVNDIVNLKIAEALCIESLKPSLNRKWERADYLL